MAGVPCFVSCAVCHRGEKKPVQTGRPHRRPAGDGATVRPSLLVLGLGQDVALADAVAAAGVGAELAVEDQVNLGLDGRLARDKREL